MNTELIGLAIALALVIFIVYTYFLTPENKKYNGKGEWKVYGTMGCGWTRKQLDELKKNGVPHKFMDCTKGMCDGQDVSGMPMNILPDGSRKVGFTSVN